MAQSDKERHLELSGTIKGVHARLRQNFKESKFLHTKDYIYITNIIGKKQNSFTFMQCLKYYISLYMIDILLNQSLLCSECVTIMNRW